ncbi:MAG TPA: ArgE/DapE family deacylase [Ktedonosporobacter sp.]|jgi:acetylornithine deacetylase|nr:ArgE/DapE family deacylase [Ktedonosporobacter sp.]
MSEVTDLLRQLVAIDSINPSLVPGGAGEDEIARFVAGWLENAGLEVQIDEVLPGRPNVIGVARGLGGGRSLLLNAHMDTVGVDGMERPHEPYIVDNRLYGRGAFDMKGGLAAIMQAAKEAKKLQLHGDVIVTAVMDEEYASAGTQSIVKRWKADAAIVTEPSGLDICIAHKGFAWFEIETSGVAAHGSLPEVGVDAIAKMGKILVGLEELERSLRAKPSHPLLGSGSVHASLIEGGQELSSYPQRCVLGLERRTVPGELSVEAEMQELIDQAGRSDPNFKATLRAGLVRQPFEVSEDEAIVRIVRNQARRILNCEPAIISAAAWMDSALLSSVGIPTVVFGPGGEGAHAVEEWADLEQLQRCTEILLATIQHFCA